MNKSDKGLIFALSAVLIWSTVATAFKIGLRELDYAQLILIGAGISSLFLLGYIIVAGQVSELFKTTGKDLLLSSLTGALNPFGYYLILFKAYSLLPAQLAQPLNMIWPLTLALLSVPLLGQKIGLKHFLAMGVSFAGIVVLSSQGGLSGFRQTNLFGVFLATGSSILWALYWILNVKDHRSEAVKLFMSFIFGFVYLLIYVAIFSDFSFPVGNSLWAAIYIGLFEAGITYLLWMKAMQMSQNNARTGSLTFLSPFISLIFISIILEEKIYITTPLGLILIITGIIWQRFYIKSR
jgi:drug/metabolite transporter (DMT)-like permease